MTGWAPPRAANDDWKDRQVFRLDSLAEVREAQDRWKKLKNVVRSALGAQATGLLCYETRDGQVHLWINDEHGQPLDMSALPDFQWLLDETLSLVGCGAWKL